MSPSPVAIIEVACLCTLEYYDVRQQQQLQIKLRIEKAWVDSSEARKEVAATA